MQSNVLMYYISAEPLLLNAQIGFVRRHKSSAAFWFLCSSWQSRLLSLNRSNWDSPQIWLKFTHRLCRLVGRALAQWAGGHGSESHRRPLVTRTFRTLMEILWTSLKVQLSQCLCFPCNESNRASLLFNFFYWITWSSGHAKQISYVLLQRQSHYCYRLKLGLCGRHESSAPFWLAHWDKQTKHDSSFPIASLV